MGSRRPAPGQLQLGGRVVERPGAPSPASGRSRPRPRASALGLGGERARRRPWAVGEVALVEVEHGPVEVARAWSTPRSAAPVAEAPRGRLAGSTGRRLGVAAGLEPGEVPADVGRPGRAGRSARQRLGRAAALAAAAASAVIAGRLPAVAAAVVDGGQYDAGCGVRRRALVEGPDVRFSSRRSARESGSSPLAAAACPRRPPRGLELGANGGSPGGPASPTPRRSRAPTRSCRRSSRAAGRSTSTRPITKGSPSLPSPSPQQLVDEALAPAAAVDEHVLQLHQAARGGPRTWG